VFIIGDLVRHVYDRRMMGVVLEESTSGPVVTVVIYRVLWASGPDEDGNRIAWVYEYCLELIEEGDEHS